MSAIRIEHIAPPRGRPASTALLARCLEIRREVFIEGQGVPEALEIDGLDEEVDHFLALDAHDREAPLLGTARLRFVDRVAKAERVAVRESERGRGVGRALMEALESRARAHGLRCVRLNAQVPVVEFYERLGYRAEGEVFEEAGIPHRAMSKPLASSTAAEPPTAHSNPHESDQPGSASR